MTILDTLRWHARALASLQTARILHLSGTLQGSGDHVTALYAGNGSNLEFITTCLFTAVLSRQEVGEASPAFLAGALSQLSMSADIVITERPPLWALIGAPTGDIRVPSWIRQELQLTGAGAERWMFGRHLEREAQRQIKRHDYRLVMSEAEGDKREFYTDFYQPYIRSRHGSSAITVDRERFSDVCANASLAKLYAGDSWTAGLLLRRRAEMLQLGWFGSKLNPTLPGASEVLDVLCIKAAAQRGVRRVDFGNSRPSLMNGVVRYKKRFGARVLMPRYPQTIIELQLGSTRAALRDWLTRQQFLCINRGELAVARYSAEHLSTAIEFDPLPIPLKS